MVKLTRLQYRALSTEDKKVYNTRVREENEKKKPPRDQRQEAIERRRLLYPSIYPTTSIVLDLDKHTPSPNELTINRLLEKMHTDFKLSTHDQMHSCIVLKGSKENILLAIKYANTKRLQCRSGEDWLSITTTGLRK